MKDFLKTTGKKVSVLTLSCLMLFGTVMPAAQVFAADAAKGIEVNVDRTGLDKAVKSAKDAGVPVQKAEDTDKGVTKTKEEAEAKAAEIKADYEEQIQALKDAQKTLTKCKEEQKKYDAAKKKYDEELAKYNIAKKKYDDEMTAYNKAMEELEKKKNQDGYMVKPYPQYLTFKSEPNAKISVNGKVYQSAEWLQALENMGYPKTSEVYNSIKRYDKYAIDEGASRVYLEKDKPLTVTYTNLRNSSFNGKKISRVVYTYTLKKITASGKNKIPAILYYDPTTTINYSDLGTNAEVQMTANFYDADGKQIDMTGALLNFSSLNRNNDAGKDKSEYVRDFNGEFVKISGSSIDVQNGIAISSTKSNESVANGARFNYTEWDTTNAPYKWYGAIIGRVTEKTIKVTFGANQRTGIWFAFNSDLKAPSLPIKPEEPTRPTPPEMPVCPRITANYHYDLLYYQPAVEKDVLDQDDKDINDNTVRTGSVVKFALHMADLPAGHELIKSLEYKDVLPGGYRVDVEGTRNASPDYDIYYDEQTRLMVFTAKATLLTQINSDLSKEAKIPAPIVTGVVTKEGATYTNEFDLNINNTYSVKSNTVKVHTPKKPTKPSIDHPKTGDSSQLPLYGMILLISAGTMMCLLRAKQK